LQTFSDDLHFFYKNPKLLFIMNTLLLENIHPVAVQIFNGKGFKVESLKTTLAEDELIAKINADGIQILGIRSKTKLTAKVFQSCPTLKVVGAFCIGTSGIDMQGANQAGVNILNAPFANGRSVAELVIGEIICLMRKAMTRSMELHAGVWNKSATGCHEVRGKTLGIIGYGNIGSQIGVLAEGLGMKVVFFDLMEKPALGNATKCATLEEMLPLCDALTLHIEGGKRNDNFFDKSKMNMLKDGAVLINFARGNLIHIPDLVECLKSGKIGGAGLDVFPTEPSGAKGEFVSELSGVDNVILTPHVGGSTEEAQFAIGEFVPAQILAFLEKGESTMSCNLPRAMLMPQTGHTRIGHLHTNTPGILAKINTVLGNHNYNISGQVLRTNEQLGYVIMDIDNEVSNDFVAEMRAITGTLKCWKI
jgi:D-3-phosphoglycerate dehydrogenase / 2-oxoglutarate reductase